MKRSLQSLFTAGFLFAALLANAQVPTFSSAATTTTTNIRVTFAGGNLTAIPGTFTGFTITGATISAAAIVGGAGNSAQVDLTVSALAPNFTCSACVAVAANTVTNASGNNAVIAATGNNVTDGVAPVITSVSIPNAAMNVGDVVTATIIVNSDGDVYTLQTSNVGGFSLGGISKTNNTTYTATFTITNGGTDVIAANNIPLSVVVQDAGGNNSTAFTTAIAQGGDPIDANNPVITAVSIPNAAMNVGDVVTATITVNSDPDVYTLPGGSTIGGFALGGLSKTNNTTYTATFTITEGGTDVAAGSNIPISVILNDGATNVSNTFTTAIAQAGDPIDANSPVITAVTIPNAAMNVGDVVTATITVVSDVAVYTLPGGSTIGGFALGGLSKTNNTTYTATFTITNGGTDVAAGSNIPISVVLQDPATNLSNTFTTAIAQGGDPIDANNPVITAVSIPDVAMIVGNVVTATITVVSDADVYTLGASNINGFALGGISKTNNTTYTATFTVTNGGTDRTAGANIPISVIVIDGATNSSAAFTTAIVQANDPIDANNPSFTSVLPSPSSGTANIGDAVQVNLTATGAEATLVAGPAMTVNGVDVIGTFTNLGGGNYRVIYTVASGNTDRAAGTMPISLQFNDASGNLATIVAFTAANTLAIDANAPVITAVSVPDVLMNVGAVVTATITVVSDAAVYTLPGGSTIGGFTLGGLSKINNTTYTATFTITNGGTDVPAASDIPVSITLQDPATNPSNNFTTAISQANDRIDANRPVITAVSIPNVNMKVGDVVTATITVNSDVDVYTLPGGSTIGGFALGGLSKTNNTTYTATFTITNGGTDVAAAANIPVNVTLQDTGGNNNSPAFTTAIAQAGDRIDANNPSTQTVGSVLTTGGTVRAGFWNSTNSGVNVQVPILNDASLFPTGTIQLEGKISTDVTWTPVGTALVLAAFSSPKTIALTAVQFEGIPNFAEGVTVQIRAVTTDVAGNFAIQNQSLTTLFVDQVAPTILGSPFIYYNGTESSGYTGGTNDREVIIFSTTETLDRQAAAATGTITAATNSANVTGVGTLFTTELAVGQALYAANADRAFIGIIQSIGTNLALTLTANARSPITAGNFTRALVVNDYDNNSSVGIRVEDGDNDVTITSRLTHYFPAFAPTYTSSATFTNAIRIIASNANSNWSHSDPSGISQVSYVAGGSLRDLAGNEFTLAGTNVLSGSTTPPAVTLNTMTLFPRSTNPEKIVFGLDAELNHPGIVTGTGTIVASTGSTTVTGTGTDFVTELTVGQQLWTADGYHYLGQIASIGSVTSLTLAANSAYTATNRAFASSTVTGTITTSTLSPTVTGIGTLFTAQLAVGQELWDVTGTTKIGTISSITNNTTIVLSANAGATLVAQPYTVSVTGFTTSAAVPFSAIYTDKGGANTITLLAPAHATWTGATTVSYTGASGNAVGTNSVELLDITNHAIVMETVAPVITSVTVPDVTMKVGDVVIATITTQDDDGDNVTLTSGAINGFALGGLTNVNGTTKTATFTVVEGGTDVAGASNITFSTNLVITDSSFPTASAPYNTAIVQANDIIDANSPRVLSINRQTTANNGAPSFGTSSATAVFRVTFNENVAPGSISAADFIARMKGLGQGSITTSTASPNVTGVGTSFGTQLTAGDEIWDRTGTILIGTVNSIITNTSLILNANAGATLVAQPWSSPAILNLTGAVVGAPVAITGTSVYDITVSSYSGLGILGLDYDDNNDVNSVTDIAGNGTITSIGVPDGDFRGQTYQIVLPEPSTHVTALTATATALDNYSLKLDWTGTSTGATNYLIIARGLTDLDAAGAYPAVGDKVAVPDDTDFTDGQGAINISSALNTYTFTTLLSGKTYDFTVIPYALSPNNTADNIDFFIAAAPAVNGTFTNRASASTLTAGTTAAPTTISSLSTAFGAKNFTFTISDDPGALAAIDNARTRFTQLVISAGTGNTVTNWSDVIQEAELRTVTETTTVLVSGGAIGASTITFPTSTADNAEGEVDDNEVKEYELRIRLKNPMTGTAPQNVDGQVFVFQVATGGFTMLNAPSRSSLFGATETEDSGAGTTVNVVATTLSFTAAGAVQPPATAFVLTNLTATPIARAIDANGNTDRGYNSVVNITNTGGLPMTSTSLTAALGIITFPAGFQYTDDLVFAAGNGTLTLSDGVITNATSTSVTVSYSNTSTITAGALSEPSTVSSLTNASPGTAVFDFAINEDFGAAGDGSPTRISSIVITQGTGNDIGTWTDVLAVGGATLTDGTTTISGTVNAGNITFSGINVATLGLVNDGTTKTYTLNVWLRSTLAPGLPATVDNLNLVFEVLQANVGVTSLSSTIAPGENENSGAGNNAVNVIATQLVFTTSPAATLLPNVPVSGQLPIPVVEALDANNNRDLNYNSTTIAVSNAGSLPMQNVPATNSMNLGLLTFPASFQYNNVGNGTLTVSTTTLNAAAGIPTSAVSAGVTVQAGTATTITAGGSPSLTIASTVNTVGAAVGAFNFTVNDDPVGSTQNDGNPTLITQLVINQTAPNGITDWTQAIAGAVLTDGTNSTPTSGTVTINPTNITISGITTHLARTGTINITAGTTAVTGSGTLFTTQLAVGQVLYDAAGTTRIGAIASIGSNTALTLSANSPVTLSGANFSTANLGLVADDGSKTYTLRIFLNSTLGGTLPITIDGLAFGFRVTTSDVTTNLSGTALLALQDQNSGALNNVVTVTATKLTFVQLDGLDNFAFPANPFPGAAFINTPFNPRLGMEARDVNNNRDLGFTGAITAFTVNNSLGTSNNPAGSFAAGTFKFPSTTPALSFIYTSGDNQDGALTVTAGGVTSTSPPINVSSSQDVYVYFDDTGYTPLINSATQQSASMPGTADATIATLARLILSDGGAANFESTGVHAAVSDADGAFTRISQISFALTNSADLRTLALYNNAGTKISSDVAAGPTVNFTGLNIQAADNSTIDFTLRTTFASTIGADHDQVNITITGVTQSAGSLLYQGPTPPSALYKGGVLNGDVSDPTANRIDVVATQLVFTQQPPPFAGILEPVPYIGTPVTEVRSVDANNNLDVDFNASTTATIASGAGLQSSSFAFGSGVNAGILNLGSLQYTSVGNGTLTVTISSGLPGIIEGVPFPQIAAPTAAISNNVEVLDVTAALATGGVTTSRNLAGGSLDKVIFGVTFNATYQTGAPEPKLSSFVIGFGLTGPTDQITDILTNVRIFENTSASFGGPNITTLTGTIVPWNGNKEYKITFSSPRDLTVARSYFLQVDVQSTANGSSTPKIQPMVKDLGFTDPATENNIGTTRGSARAQVNSGPPLTSIVYGFSSIFPPTLAGSYPASGQINVAKNQPKLSLNFSVPVWTMNNKIYLYDQTAGGPPVVLLADTTSQVVDPACQVQGGGTVPCKKNGSYFQSAGGTINNRANPVLFHLPPGLATPVNLIENHVYYVTVDPGFFGGATATNNKGFMDEAGNLFAGISYSGTLYFKTADPNPPNMLHKPTAGNDPAATGTIVSGTISATFDKAGKAHYIVLPVAAGTPTPDQITGLVAGPPGTIAQGNFPITLINPNAQFGVFTPQVALTAGTLYNVWMSSTSESEFSATGLAVNAVKSQVPATSPAHFGKRGKVAKAGTLSVTLGSTIVTGSGTSFSSLVPGRTLFTAADTTIVIGTIATITDNFNLTLASPASVTYSNIGFFASGFEVGDVGPSLKFRPTAVSGSVVLNNPAISLCTDAFQILTDPITISESSGGADFSGAGPQTFNLVLPAGFEFDNSMASVNKPNYGLLTLVGNDFTPGSVLPGTITTSIASPVVTGTGTAFLSQFTAGDVIYNGAGTILVGTVASVSSNTVINLTANANIALAGATYFGPYVTRGNPKLKFVGNAILTVSYLNNGSASTDKIIISGLRVKSTTATSGPIQRFGGNALLGPIPDLQAVAGLSSAQAAGIPFYNSYSVQQFGNFAVTTIPNNFNDSTIVQPFVAQLVPNPPFGDFGPSSFSGPGVNVNLLNLNAVTLGAPFNITINHKDNNGCPSTSFEQYTVYDSATAIADLSTQYLSINSNFTISNPTAPATSLLAGNKVRVTFNRLQSYYLDALTADVDPEANPSQVIFGTGWQNVLKNMLISKDLPSIQTGITLGVGGGYDPANNPNPGHEYFDYKFDEATILNAKVLDPTIASNPYEFPPFVQFSPNNNVYYTGGSLGRVSFTGSFQSIANANLPPIPLIQKVEFFVPAVPIIETSPASYTDLTDLQNPPGAGNPGGPVIPTFGRTGTITATGGSTNVTGVGTFFRGELAPGRVIYDGGGAIIGTVAQIVDDTNLRLTVNAPVSVSSGYSSSGSKSSNPGTLVFCQLGGDIQISAYPAASPGASLGRFRVVDHLDSTKVLYDAQAGITNDGFTDNTNGTAKIDPTLFESSTFGTANGFRSIRIIYIYKDNRSPNPPSRAIQVIRITPNPVASFAMTSTTNPYPFGHVVSTAAKCAGEPITFTSGATCADPKNSTLISYDWNFGDPTSSQNIATGPASNILPHTFATASPPGVPYVVTHFVTSFWNCPSVVPGVVPAVTANAHVGQIPDVKFSVIGVAKGDVFTFRSTDPAQTTVAANDTINNYLWKFGEGTPGTDIPVTGLADNAAYNSNLVNFTYTGVGPKSIDLVVETNKGCSNSLSQQGTYRDIVVLDRFVFANSSTVYAADFEGTTANWQPWGTSDNNIPDMVAGIASSSWGHGAPAFPLDPADPLYGARLTLYNQILQGPSLGVGQCWKTNPTGTYNVGEQSALYSLSFDLSKLERPMISFNSMALTSTSDGVVLQFSTDSLNIADPKKKWRTLGQIGDGQDWFDVNAIAGKPGQQPQDDFGWSTANDSMWVEPKHTLDTVNSLAINFSSTAVFRFALGASTGTTPQEGFWMDNFRIGDRTRTILLESFWNLSQANQLGEANAVADFKDDNIGTEVVKLNYHVNFPGKDPFNEDNPADPSSRALFYNITQTPSSILDGYSVLRNDPFSTWGLAQYDKRTLDLAQADIEIVPTVNTDGTISIDIEVTSTALTGIPANTIMHVAITEMAVPVAKLPANKQGMIASALDTVEFVVKKMLPSAAGTVFGTVTTGADLAFKDSISFPTITYLPDASRLYDDPNDIAIAVFLQQSTPPYEVYQVELMDSIADPTAVTGLEPLAAEQVKVYPNPAHREMTVQLPGPLSKPAALTMIDQTGRQVVRSSMTEGSDRQTINVTDLSSGVYILTVDMGSGVLTRKKVMVVHQD